MARRAGGGGGRGAEKNCRGKAGDWRNAAGPAVGRRGRRGRRHSVAYCRSLGVAAARSVWRPVARMPLCYTAVGTEVVMNGIRQRRPGRAGGGGPCQRQPPAQHIDKKRKKNRCRDRGEVRPCTCARRDLTDGACTDPCYGICKRSRKAHTANALHLQEADRPAHHKSLVAAVTETSSARSPTTPEGGSGQESVDSADARKKKEKH